MDGTLDDGKKNKDKASGRVKGRDFLSRSTSILHPNRGKSHIYSEICTPFCICMPSSSRCPLAVLACFSS